MGNDLTIPHDHNPEKNSRQAGDGHGNVAKNNSNIVSLLKVHHSGIESEHAGFFYLHPE